MRSNRHIFAGRGSTGGSSPSTSNIVEFSDTIPKPTTGEAIKIYLNTDNGDKYKWNETDGKYTLVDSDRNDKVFFGTADIDYIAGTDIDISTLSFIKGEYSALINGNTRQVIQINSVETSVTVTGDNTVVFSIDVYEGDVISAREV